MGKSAIPASGFLRFSEIGSIRFRRLRYLQKLTI